METKRKKTLWNLIMAALILVIAGCGVMVVGSVKGWFVKTEEAMVTVSRTTGVVNIERSGVGFTLKKDVAIQVGDVIATRKGSSAELEVLPGNAVTVGENTELRLAACADGQLQFELLEGELFADAPDAGKGWELLYGGNTASVRDAVFAANAYTGSSALLVFAGDAEVVEADGTQEYVQSGEYLSVSENTKDGAQGMAAKLSAASLNEFVIAGALKCASGDALCFTSAELQKVLDDRAAEKQAALEASLNSGSRIPKEAAENETDAGREMEDGSENADAQNGGADDSDGAGSVQEYVSRDDSYEEQKPEQNADIKECTITIVCDTILNNMENLSDGKEAYVPANGCILTTSTVEFLDGETVFDVLNRVCSYAGIQLEYSWTPMYNSYYIEGINNLYEFDCGNESGWMYKVNGWFPNYGCSVYSLEDGDAIVWTYTCNGLGADVGGSVY